VEPVMVMAKAAMVEPVVAMEPVVLTAEPVMAV
jgi:hypothetical protein